MWGIDEDSSPIGPPRVSCTLGDVDGDGVEDGAIGNAWAGHGDAFAGSLPGAVSVLSGADGTIRWARWGTVDAEGVGTDVESAGDYDGDGVDDVAVLVASPSGEHGPSRLDVWSGASGDTLASVTLDGERPFALRSAGDLDGDGLDEWLLDDGRRGILSVSGGGRVDMTRGLAFAWLAPAGDLDGDGADDLVLGVEDDGEGSRSIRVATRSGVQRFAAVAATEPSWRDAGAATGDFDGDGLWDVALVTGSRWDSPDRARVRVLFGAALR